MSTEREPNESDAQVDDLDVSDDEAEAVKGGLRADPCEGGE